MLFKAAANLYNKKESRYNMAEFNMTYEDLRKYLSTCIEKSKNKENLQTHAAEILAALTASDDTQPESTTKDNITLWENQIQQPSELLFGTHYIRVKDCVIAFIEVACTSGILDCFLAANPAGVTVGTASSIAISLISFFSKISNLEDGEFCVYMHAAKNGKKHKAFTKSEVESWLPDTNNAGCNIMHSKWNSTRWDCVFCENAVCKFVESGQLEIILESLVNKHLLKKERTDTEFTYTFEY